MNNLESVYVNSNFYASNREGTVIYSKDGTELVCIIKTLEHFEIPEGVKIIKTCAFYNSNISNRLIIPSSVEIIEDDAFFCCMKLKIIEFAPGSKLKSLGFRSLNILEDLIIKREDGVVISQNPPGIVFVPKHLTELEVDTDIESIYSYAFYESNIKNIKLPKSLKKIMNESFLNSKIENITFEEGTELKYIKRGAFSHSRIQNLKLPLVKSLLEEFSLECSAKLIELPPNFSPSIVDEFTLSGCFKLETIICPASSLQFLAQNILSDTIKVLIVEDQ